MLTKHGRSVLDELNSELSEQIEDQKNTLRLEQAKIWVSSWYAIFNITMKFVHQCTVLIILLAFIVIDESIIQILQQASVQELLDFRDKFILPFMILTVGLSLTWWLMQKRNAMRNIKRDVAEEKANQLNEAKGNVELIEEVLYRHNLIKKGG